MIHPSEMILILALLPFLLADVVAGGASQEWLSDDEELTATFKEVHNETVLGLEWNDKLAKQARKKSLRIRGTEVKWKQEQLVLIGNRPLKEDEKPKAKLRDSLTRLLNAHKGEIKEGSKYGCDGYADATEEGFRSLHFACIYCTMEATSNKLCAEVR